MNRFAIAPEAFDSRAPIALMNGHRAAIEFRGRGVSLYRDVRDDLHGGGASAVMVALRKDTERQWLDAAVPLMLASDRVDAMTKLRLAARWAEAKA